MKWKKYLFLVIIVTVFGCGPDCSDIFPIRPTTLIKLVDSDGKALLGSQYDLDSILLYSKTDTTYLVFWEGDSSIEFWYSQWNSNDEYLLKLNSTDIDTISLIYHFETGECFDIPIIDTFRYNQLTWVDNEDFHEIIKE